MTTIPEVVQTLQAVLQASAQAAGRPSGFVQRQSKLGGAEWVQTLVFGWLADPHATLEALAQTAGDLGLSISAQALDERFTPAAAECLRRVLDQAVQRLVRADPVDLPLWQAFQGVYVLDSTTLSLPVELAELWRGCGGGQQPGDGAAALKVQVQWELQTGQLRPLQLQPGRAQDRTAPADFWALPAGALCLTDLGYFSLGRLAAQAAQGVYWLTRVQASTELHSAGRRWSLAAWLAAQPAGPVDQVIELGIEQRLPCRLLARRVRPELAQQRRRRLQAAARHRGSTVRAATLALADWEVLATNVPPGGLSLTQAWDLARVRWQIELLFKLWKSHGQVDEWRSAKPWRILCEVYAKLLGQLVQHWLLLLSCWALPDRSLRKAAQTLRRQAGHLAAVFHQHDRLAEALAGLGRTLQRGCRVNKRRTAPSAYQRLAGLA